MYVLSPRAAVALGQCPRSDEWLKCPNSFFVDVNNVSTQTSQHQACAVGSTFNNDDLLTGACLAEARMVARTHPCFINTPAAPWAVTAWAMRTKALRRCPCPLSVHALKKAATMASARRLVQGMCQKRANASPTVWNDSRPDYGPAEVTTPVVGRVARWHDATQRGHLLYATSNGSTLVGMAWPSVLRVFTLV